MNELPDTSTSILLACDWNRPGTDQEHQPFRLVIVLHRDDIAGGWAPAQANAATEALSDTCVGNWRC